jgi:hypothetical protein
MKGVFSVRLYLDGRDVAFRLCDHLRRCIGV